MFTKKKPDEVPLYLYNTLTKKKEVFVPISKNGPVTMYNCGPTVYAKQHIGNIAPYIFADVLRRVLSYNGHTVQQVINITDVGHLVSDENDGEDKLEKSARETGESAQDIALKITDLFLKDLEQENIDTTAIAFPKATEYIDQQIALIQTLEEKGYTYTIDDGVYFDTKQFKSYGALGGIDLEHLKEGARVEKNDQKKNHTDFALWKLSSADPETKRQQEWDSPWGVGFPGWHIECSVMSRALLGIQIDIHTGGIDHIPIHHNNEIAQSEAATGKQFVKYWMHNAFITIDGKKISKSLGNTIYIRHLIERGMHPLAYRYWLLTGHYRSPVNFTWEAISGANTALNRLRRQFIDELGQKNGAVDSKYQKQFLQFINDDLNMPRALALAWDLLKDDTVSAPSKRSTLLEMDKVFGLKLDDTGVTKINVSDIPSAVSALASKRDAARKTANWDEADALRDEIKTHGYDVVDTDTGSTLTKI